MFIENKYTRTYNNIINLAKTRILSPEIYTEKHHIIPKSIGGSNLSDNIIILTAREHYICHRLLVKMTTGIQKSKMINAAWALANLNTNNQQRVKINSKTYAILRTQFSITHAKFRTGQKHTNETKNKISQSLIGKPKKTKGIPRTNEIKSKISATLTGREFSSEHKQNIKKNHIGFSGKIPTKEHRDKISQKRLQTQKIECLYCAKSLDPGNYKKYHGVRCKLFTV
jgi:hypothetical protein